MYELGRPGIQQADCPGLGWSGRRVDGSGEQAGEQVGRRQGGAVQKSSAEGARQHKGLEGNKEMLSE